MFRVKICGLTRADDIAAAAAAGADAVGLNFYPKSPRYVAPDRAAALAAAVPQGVLKVGLFVNATAEDVCETFDRLALGLIQLHGDEPPALLTQLGGRPVMRAFRIGPEGLAPVMEYLAECRRLKCTPKLVLADARVEGAFGGTGQVADWQLLASYARDGSLPPLVLAGGLTPENVAAAIRAVRPAAVDTASGVETSPRRKDPAQVRRFITVANDAFEAAGPGNEKK